MRKNKLFAQRQPPLCVTISRILDRYPDGQIVKELLQNAEDAGASELRLTLDLRQFGEEKLYDKRLSVCQGPALLAYNDANFTQEDWLNIQKTENSHKQIDPDKIGRFGIGFNSVYHLTDFPWILSGETIGVFDPCESGIFRNPPVKDGHPVGGKQWDLTDDADRLEIQQKSDQFDPLFKTDKSHWENHTYFQGLEFSGTLFRFPLRQTKVEPIDPERVLSSVTYTPEKIQALFTAFEADGARLLLFLTSVQKVSLWQCSQQNEMVQLYAVKNEVLPAIPKPLKNVGEFCYYEASITVTQNTGLQLLKSTTEKWAIVQFISKDTDTTRFISESELNVKPWVGVACALDADSITPDAVTQNDRRPECNEILANQLIPQAYIHLLKQIRDTDFLSDSESHSLISKLWPDLSQVKPDWKDCVTAFYKNIVNEELFWSAITSKWIAASDAVFLNPNLEQNDNDAIEKIASSSNQSAVYVSNFVPDYFEKIAGVSVDRMSPEYICKLFKKDQTLLRNELDVKKKLLDYVLSDQHCSAYLYDVPLLPLADGSFTSFKMSKMRRLAYPIFVSSPEHPRSLLPGLDHLFLSDEYCSTNNNMIRFVLNSGKTQLSRIQPNDIPNLLPKSMDTRLWNPETELESLWPYINCHFDNLGKWQSLSLIPVQCGRQNCSPARIDSKAPVLSSDGMGSEISQWLQKAFGLKLALPLPYLKKWLGSPYILNPEKPASSTLRVIRQVWENNPQAVTSAIQEASDKSRTCFQWFRNQISIACAQSFLLDNQLKKFLAALPLFDPVEGTTTSGCLITAETASCYFLKDFSFGIDTLLRQQVGFPFPLISSNSFASSVGQKMGLRELTIINFASILVKESKDGGYFSSDGKTEIVLSWLVSHYQELHSSVNFDDLSRHLVLKQFTKEVIESEKEIEPAKYANFCALLLNAPGVIWQDICQLNLIPCKNNHLHCPTQLVMNCDFKNTCPYICEPAEWVKLRCEKFLNKCNINEKLSLDNLVTIIRNIEKRNVETKLPLDENSTLKGFIEIMKEIAKRLKKQEKYDVNKLQLPLPDSNGNLVPVDKLLYNDNPKLSQSEYLLVHKDVPRHIAVYFGVKTLNDVQLEKYEDSEKFGEEFGQEVDLVERIKYLIHQYHTQSDLFQEFLQNADDAAATKIAFFLDERCHPKKGLLSEQSTELQDNAILIYNDTTFGDNDVRGIRQLGIGSKAHDKEKIGRFGAGFNCSYQYTDCPSFVSDDKFICIFDPMRWYLPKKSKGLKYDFLNQKTQTDFRKEFPSVHGTYKIKGFTLENATVFRLPLRKTSTEKSFDKVYPPSEVSEIFESAAGNIKKMMLFLRNVTEVSAYKIDNRGNLNQMWQVHSKPSSSTWMTKEQFHHEVRTFSKLPSTQIPAIRSSYQLTLSQVGKRHEEKWHICQRMGFSQIPEPDFSKVKLLPIGGVATRLDDDNHRHSLFCSLPLPQMTEMPVSINGHFVLDSEGRKNLFTSFEGESSIHQQWNQHLLNDVVCGAYLDLLEILKMKINDECKDIIFDEDILVEKIWKFWKHLPDQKSHDSSSVWSGRKHFSNAFFKMFAQSNRCLFPCLTKSNGKSSIDWLNLEGNRDGPLFPSETAFHFSRNSGIHLQKAFFLLHELGIKIVPCSQSILKAFLDGEVNIKVARPTMVAEYLKQPWIHITNLNQDLPYLITDTVFQSVDRVLSLLKFLVSSQDETEESESLETEEFQLSGLPLLVTHDKFLRYFSPSNPAKLEESEEVINLFSDHADKFVCLELRSTLHNYLIQHGGVDDCPKPLSILNLQDLLKMLPFAMDHQGIHPIVGKIPFCSYPKTLSSSWLQSFWSLIIRLTPDEDSRYKFVNLFKDFYLVPASRANDGSLLLFKIDMRSHLLLPNTWSYISETIVLDGLPIVDIQGSICPSRSEDFTTSFFGSETPEKLISSLVYWNELGYLNWPEDVLNHRSLAFGMLSYFAKFSSKSHHLQNLRKLPIFETFDGQIQKLIVRGLPVFTLDTQDNFPADGQSVWTSKALFLKKHDSFMVLYEGLDVGYIGLPKLYADFIVPSFPGMTTAEQITHLRFLHVHWYSEGFKDTIQHVLEETKFIEIGNGTKRSINQFYDHTVELFTEMCCTEDFLPEDFLTTLKTVDKYFWMQGFLHTLGLRHIPEPEEHVRFALQLSKLSLEDDLKKIKNVAGLLLDSVFSLASNSSEAESSDWDDCIMEMSKIAFIPSQKFDENLRKLFPLSEQDTRQFMQANGSFSSCCHSLVWTLTRVLPYWVPRKLYMKMGILTSPSFEYCKEHFEKLLKYLYSAKLQQRQDDGVNNPESIESLEFILKDFYRYLLDIYCNEANVEDREKIRCMELPLIYVEAGRRLAYPKVTVERLSVVDSNQFAPFLYELPPSLHEYITLFRFLGLQQKPCIWHYATYLHNVYDHQSENGIINDPNVSLGIMSAQQAMIISEEDKTVDWDSIGALYLSSSDGNLHSSCELVFNDSSATMQIHLVETNKPMKFWEFSHDQNFALHEKMDNFVKMLPDRLKLKLSSCAFTRGIHVENSEYCEYSQPCPAVERLTNLLPSTEFLECIQRLYFSENKSVDLPFNKKWEEVSEVLKSVQICCYSKLSIRLKDLENSKDVVGSEKAYTCYSDGKSLLISHEEASQQRNSFVTHLTRCLQQILSIKLPELALSDLLRCSDLFELQNTLDELHVVKLPTNFYHMLHFPTSLGSKVSNELVDFLEMHPLNHFGNGEYVAFLKPNEETNPLDNFIWAKIISCDDDSLSVLHRHYKINIGDSSTFVNVSSQDLHKFIAPIKNIEFGQLVLADIECEPESKPTEYEEACNEVTQILEDAQNLPLDEFRKVIRRLHLTWHPDKNKEERRIMATKVFQHMQNKIHQFEQEGALDKTITSNQQFHAWESFRSNSNQRWNHYSHGSFKNPLQGFNFGHHIQTTYVYPNPTMALKYWQTANYDLKAAVAAERSQRSDIGKEIGNEHVINLAQQAVEKALKAPLWAEIGAPERLHNLTYFAERVAIKTKCSSDVVEKVYKFVHECHADISRLRYPDGCVSIPHDFYTKEQATKAVSYAVAIVDDVKKPYPTFEP